MAQWLDLPQTSDYPASVKFMEEKAFCVAQNPAQYFMLLCQYEDLFTMGSSADKAHLLDIGNIACYQSSRGGQITYHGPGQRVIYPIIHLSLFNKDIRKYIRFLADTIITTLDHFDIKGFFCEDKIGVWVGVDGRHYKIASIGVRVKKWVAYHGLAVNIDPDMSKFGKIIACGIKDNAHTSMAALGAKIHISEFDKQFKTVFLKNL